MTFLKTSNKIKHVKENIKVSYLIGRGIIKLQGKGVSVHSFQCNQSCQVPNRPFPTQITPGHTLSRTHHLLKCDSTQTWVLLFCMGPSFHYLYQWTQENPKFAGRVIIRNWTSDYATILSDLNWLPLSTHHNIQKLKVCYNISNHPTILIYPHHVVKTT